MQTMDEGRKTNGGHLYFSFSLSFSFSSADGTGSEVNGTILGGKRLGANRRIGLMAQAAGE
jgi:hypothetical protein